MSQGETDNEFFSQHTDDDVPINLNFNQEQLDILYQLGFNDDFLELLNHRTFENILNEYLSVARDPIEQGGFNLQIDNIQQAIANLDNDTKVHIADSLLSRLGPTGGKGKKRSNKRKTKRRINKKRTKRRMTNKKRTKRRIKK